MSIPSNEFALLRQPSDVLPALRLALGDDSVLTGAAAAERLSHDWSTAPSIVPSIVLLPRTPQNVAAALRICNEAGQPVCVQGGLTGLAGGANPLDGEVVLSLARLSAIEDFDKEGGTVVVQAGVTLEALQNEVEDHGWFFPLDLGARGSCQLGGNAATNAGGNRVLRFGMMRNAVWGLEVALPDGTLLTMLDRVMKNNAGFDLKHLFIGSEGCLGVITRLSLALVPKPAASCTALCAVPDFGSATRLLREARRSLPELGAFELMWDDYLEAGAAAIGKTLPFDRPHPLYVLIETLSSEVDGGATAVERCLETALEEGWVTDVVVARSVDQARKLWAYREAVGELLSLTKPCAAFDVSVPMFQMDGTVQELKALLTERYPFTRHLFFGHLGDGNLHLISGPYPDADLLDEVEDLVYAAIGRRGGSISAEHGIGTVKKPFLHHSRGADELRCMRLLKQLFDSNGILNPGRVLT